MVRVFLDILHYGSALFYSSLLNSGFLLSGNCPSIECLLIRLYQDEFDHFIIFLIKFLLEIFLRYKRGKTN